MLNIAADLARTRPRQKLPRLVAILETRKGVYVGQNSYKTHPLAKKFGRNNESICLHAEVDAIRKALMCGDEVEGSTLFVARVLKNGREALAKPCEGCQRAIIHFGVKNVHWTKD